MDGQIKVVEYLNRIPDVTYAGCGMCLCRNCLYYHSGRCPYGKCFDDKRAIESPYDKAHPGEPARTAWSNWEKDQAYWCRGGKHYPAYNCKQFVKYKGVKLEPCIRCNIMVYQDGYQDCPLAENPGCETCYQYLMEKMDSMED